MMGMASWIAATLRQYPEIAIFLTLALGYYFGKFTFKGIGLGSVTATLLAGVLIGQLGITISAPLKATVFLLFLFAVGYGVGPQFVRGVAKDGLPQALFSVVQCVLCLLVPVVIAKFAGYDLGYAAGLYSGSQTISAALGLSTDAINRLGLAAADAKRLIDSMPIAYAVTYMFGTVGSAIVAEAMVPNARVFVQRLRRDGVIEEATADTVLREGDVVAIAGSREALVSIIGERAKVAAVAGSRDSLTKAASEVSIEVDDPELLSVPVEGVDVYVTNKEVDGKTLAELAQRPGSRGVFLRRITRGATATTIPILPNTQIYRGDIVTLVGRTQDIAAASKMLGVMDRPTDIADVAFIGGAITLGALVGALVLKVSGVPLTLSTAGGALIAGLVFGWLRSVRPLFGRIPSPTVWFMNSVGLNIFIAVVGISAGPGFVNGLKTQGIGLFLWGAVATTLPLIIGMFIGQYLFRL